MFDFVGRNKRLLQGILVVVIIPPFAFWGIESYQRAFSSGTDVAEVGGQKISEQELNEQVRQQQERMRAMLGRNFQPGMFDSPAVRAQVLEGMISQRLLVQQALRGNLMVTDDALRAAIASIPAFQENGAFSKARYEEVLRGEGYSPAMFENSLRRDLLVQQLTGAIGDAGFVSRAAARAAAALSTERREIAEHFVTADAYAAKVQVGAEAINAYYDANRARFQIPESAKIEYLVLNAEALAASETVGADEVKAWYDANVDRFGEKEQRQASHILVSVKAGATAEARAAARQKAESLLAQARKEPARFAELAKKNSDDPGSAARGGDLGFFSRGNMVRPFEDAVFAIKPNEIAGPVESEFGFHVIRLTAMKPAKLRPLEEVRAEIERELRKQRAGRRFAEAAEVFSNLVYEQPDSLKPAAEKFRLTIQTAERVTRQSAGIESLNNPRLLAAVFGEESVKNRRNTEAVETAPGTLVSARVVEHRPSSLRPLDQVRPEIVRQITQTEAAKLAHAEGARRLDALKKGESGGPSFGPSKIVARDDARGARPEAIAAAFRVGRDRLPAFAGVEVANGYAIVRVSRVIEGELDPSREKGAQAELGRLAGAREVEAYLAALRARAKVEINRSLLEKKTQP